MFNNTDSMLQCPWENLPMNIQNFVLLLETNETNENIQVFPKT